MRISVFFVLAMICYSIVKAQDKVYVHTNSGEAVPFDISNVDEINFLGNSNGNNDGQNTNTVLKPRPIRKKPVMIDLGLPSGTLWADCNVGAAIPGGYGYYLGWGEVEEAPSLCYSSGNSCTYGHTLEELVARGITDKNGVLTPEYDAATYLLGEEYRMPTYEEAFELINSCTWKHATASNGYPGVVGTGPNGNTIFFIRAGHRRGWEVFCEGGNYECWQRTADGRSFTIGYDKLYIREKEPVLYDRTDWGGGVPVRAVMSRPSKP